MTATMRSVRTALLTLIGSALILLAATPASGTAKPVSSPSSFKEDLESTLASDGQRLWFATVGLDRKKKTRAEVKLYRDGRWRLLGGRPLAESGYDTLLEIRKGKGNGPAEPCFGYVGPGDVARVRCFEKGRWQAKRIPKKLRRAQLEGLRVTGRKVLAVFIRRAGKPITTSTKISLARLVGNRFRPIGKPVTFLDGQTADFVRNLPGAGNRLELEVGSPGTGIRRIISWRGKRWQRSNSFTGPDEESSWLTTPIRARDGSFYYPRTLNRYTEHYLGRTELIGDLFIYRLDQSTSTMVSDGPASNGIGSSQGGIYPVGDRIWTVWNENDPEGMAFGGDFHTKVFAARIDREGTGFDRKVRLWSGRTYFPGSTDAVLYRGGPVFLYDRQFKAASGLRATVDLTHRNETSTVEMGGN